MSTVDDMKMERIFGKVIITAVSRIPPQSGILDRFAIPVSIPLKIKVF